jgi:hypothetical protein
MEQTEMMKRSLLAAAALALIATTAQAQHYITPTGPTKVVRHGTVGCLAFEDFVKVTFNKFEMETAVGLIKSRRCFAMPVGTSVEMVEERGRFADGREVDWICVKPAGTSGSSCLWILIRSLDVAAF